MQKRHIDRERYFNEQAQTASAYYIPYITSFTGKLPDTVLEIGCGEGGNLLPFAKAGCKVTGVDMAESKISNAIRFFRQNGAEGSFIAEDVFNLTGFRNAFSLIIVHDVIEHIYEKRLFLESIKEYLKPGGMIFIAFPAWQMPFGGHQQIASGKFISHMPFIHLLPARIYEALLRFCGESDEVISELLDIKRTRCSIETFTEAAAKAGYGIAGSQLYFINPNYEVKFGLKPRKLWPLIASVPYVRNFFSTSCFYMLRPADQM